MRRLYLALLPMFAVACAHQQVDDYYGSQLKSATPAATEPTLAKTTNPGAGSSSNAAACHTARVHFDRDDTLLHPDDYPVLQQLAQCLKDNHTISLRIEGNADERGTTDYNLALGDRRARSVAGYLKMLGVTDSQLATVSYGKEKPLCEDHDEQCWHENRRAGLTMRR